jgi:hypothetical protein
MARGHCAGHWSAAIWRRPLQKTAGPVSSSMVPFEIWLNCDEAQVGIRALALVPLRTAKRDLEGQADIPVQIQGVWVRPGDWLYADEDGIVVSARALHG